MDDAEPAPELFVARDRARNFARRIGDTRQERRLAYQGADVGMASLVNEADRALVTMIDEAAQTVEDIVHQRIRDRERGYMEMPLAVVAESVAARARLARRLDRAVDLKEVPAKEGHKAALALLEEALARIDAFCEAYDAKQPLGAPRPLVLAHLLEQVEEQAAWARRVTLGVHEPAPAFDRIPPDIVSEPHGLADLLHAARACVLEAPGPWRVQLDDDEHALVLSLGTVEGGAIDAPDRLQRAIEVLRFRHPLDVACFGEAAPETGLLSTERPQPIVRGVRILLPRPGKPVATEEVEAVDLEALAKETGVLTAEAERAVSALALAGPLQDTPSPTRAVAWMGLFKELDRLLKEIVAARCRSHPCQAAARRLPRDDTRKAPLKTAVLQTLTAQFHGMSEHRIDPVADLLAHGKADPRLGRPEDAAIVIALVGRRWNAAGVDMPPALVLAPLSDLDVNTLIADLVTLAGIRRTLESGGAPTAADAARMERACVSALARLGRVATA